MGWGGGAVSAGLLLFCLAAVWGSQCITISDRPHSARPQVLFRVALAILKLHEPQLLKVRILPPLPLYPMQGTCLGAARHAYEHRVACVCLCVCVCVWFGCTKPFVVVSVLRLCLIVSVCLRACLCRRWTTMTRAIRI